MADTDRGKMLLKLLTDELAALVRYDMVRLSYLRTVLLRQSSSAVIAVIWDVFRLLREIESTVYRPLSFLVIPVTSCMRCSITHVGPIKVKLGR